METWENNWGGGGNDKKKRGVKRESSGVGLTGAALKKAKNKKTADSPKK